MTTFEERRADWERRIERVIIDMTRECDANGMAIYIDTTPVINEFNKIIERLTNSIEQSRTNQGTARLIPGDRLNED